MQPDKFAVPRQDVNFVVKLFFSIFLRFIATNFW